MMIYFIILILIIVVFFLGAKLCLIKETVLTLLGRGGVLHITCANSETKDCDLESGNSVKLSGSGNDTTIKAVSVGESRCEVSVKKKKDCAFHSGQSGEGEIIIYVFGKPTAEARYSDSIALTNTEKGVTYTINGVSKTCTQNGQELEFTGLQKTKSIMLDTMHLWVLHFV